MVEIPLTTRFFLEPEFYRETIGAAADACLQAAHELGTTRAASVLRAWSIPYVYRGLEQAFDSGQEPVAQLNQVFARLTEFLQSAVRHDFHSLGADEQSADFNEADQAAVEAVTGQHYGNLFQAFSAASFWEEPVALLRTRLERNELALARLTELTVLDAGCGGGRYTAAWRLLGARKAVGVDVSPINIQGARQRVQAAQLDQIEFQEGSVLDLPFADSSFDIVFSNGVLHHTVDWRTGLQEALRVLKPGGLGWLYLIEKPGGLYWTTIEVLRALMQSERHETARRALQQLGLPDNRIFYMLDHVMAPVNERLTAEEIKAQLAAVGAVNIRRLARGTDFDRIERCWRNEPFATLNFGVGEQRFVFSKTA
jgi:ubiquinone/menaquinone biosynthesis C-methylase UbiE